MQLDLFDADSKPKDGRAVIVAFPLSRDVGRVRRIAAAVLKRRSPAAQQREFARHALELQRKLGANHIPEAEVARQICDFTRAINAELLRIEWGNRRSPGGAA
jgi:hypothetical protein